MKHAEQLESHSPSNYPCTDVVTVHDKLSEKANGRCCGDWTS
jgi:hypothetical protein